MSQKSRGEIIDDSRLSATLIERGAHKGLNNVNKNFQSQIKHYFGIEYNGLYYKHVTIVNDDSSIISK
jgi:hypothetical protein